MKTALPAVVALVVLMISLATSPIDFAASSVFGIPAFVYLLSQSRKS